MKSILSTLNDNISSRGAIVVAKDGMLVASDVREGIDEDRLAALGAAVVTEITESLQQADMEGFKQLEVTAEQGKVILVEAGPTFLLVLLGARLEIGPGSIEIQSAAQRVAREAKFAAT